VGRFLRIVVPVLIVSLLSLMSGRAEVGYATHNAVGNKALLGVLLSSPNRGAALLASQSSWEKDIVPSEFANKNLLLPRPISEKTWFILGFWSSTSFDQGTVLRTNDGGVTWAPLPPPPAPNHVWQDFTRDAYGRLWGLSLDTTTNSLTAVARVWYSDGGGDNWIQSYSSDQPGSTRR